MAGDNDFGLIGLGVMGRNFILNVADHGFRAVGYNRDPLKGQTLTEEGRGKPVMAVNSLAALAAALRAPRIIMMLVPAGAAVDDVIHNLIPLLGVGDILIDGGNSFFADTDRRMAMLESTGIHYLGIGVSGGESGARHGPSLMPGGSAAAYERVRPIFEAAAAKVNGEACVTYLGPGSAGHYVKMVHNGIEYGLMQVISESYEFMKRGLGLDNARLHQIYSAWNGAELGGFLMEITAEIFAKADDLGTGLLVDQIKAEAHQKGTGMWTSQEALTLGVPTPTIDAAVAARNISAMGDERRRAATVYPAPQPSGDPDERVMIEQLRHGLYAGMVITYAQGMAMLNAASHAHGYNLDLGEVARIWRGGCIIRSALLEDFRAAFTADPALPNLLLAPGLANEIRLRQGPLRQTVAAAATRGIPVPGLMSALAYLDGYRGAWSPANLIQAQRDYFGAHTYERIDRAGIFHTRWSEV
jgi:6-phosphogluconate dehydrogenase